MGIHPGNHILTSEWLSSPLVCEAVVFRNGLCDPVHRSPEQLSCCFRMTFVDEPHRKGVVIAANVTMLR